VAPGLHDFTPIRPNPYIVGNPVRNPAMFFGRAAEFELVQKRFAAAARGSLMVFCGERRSGKTSILMQIQQGRLGNEFLPVLIDLQAMVAQNEAEFLAWIVDEIARQRAEDTAPLPLAASGPSPAAAFRRTIESLVAQESGCKLVLMFDEYELFEEKIDKGILPKEVLYLLSSLIENLPVFLIFTGSQHLEERRRDYWNILAKAHEYRRISYLEPSDAIRLVREPLAGRAEYTDAAVGRILRLSAGQPFYTQAICQYVVDALNKNRTGLVTEDLLEPVIQNIVEHPFPQMNFVWDSLPAEQKLALAVLAETLRTEDDRASVDDLLRSVRQGRYPLNVERPVLASSLDLLFKQELLALSSPAPATYAFRMDLWRLWIRRLHSVWRVLRDENLGGGARRPRRRGAALVALACVILGAALWPALRRTAGPKPEPAAARLAPALAPSDSADPSLPAASAAALGWLALTARPADAEIDVDGRVVGRGSAHVEVAAEEPHQVEVRLGGHETIRRTLRVGGGATRNESFELAAETFGLLMQTAPDSATVFVDGEPRGVSDLYIDGLRAGFHDFRLQRQGFVSKDTTVTIDANTKLVTVRLTEEPPAVLVVRGDRPARIRIDGHLVGSGELRNSDEQRRRAGRHTVALEFRDGGRDEVTVDLKPGQQIELVWEGARFLRPFEE
jgi:hypothetical protein